MKLVRLMQVSSLAAVGALASVNVSAGETAATSASTAAAAPSYTDEQVFEAFGYLVGQRIGISEFNLTEGEKAAALKGIEECLGDRRRHVLTLDSVRPLRPSRITDRTDSRAQP